MPYAMAAGNRFPRAPGPASRHGDWAGGEEFGQPGKVFILREWKGKSLLVEVSLAPPPPEVKFLIANEWFALVPPGRFARDVPQKRPVPR